MSELLKLAERCEQATGPDRELMIDVFDAVFPDCPLRWDGVGDPRPWSQDSADRWLRYLKMLDCGASLDAAMTLVPEGCTFDLSTDYGDGYAGIYTADGNDMPQIRAEAKTLALALCAAALRARAATKGEGDKLP